MKDNDLLVLGGAVAACLYFYKPVIITAVGPTGTSHTVISGAGLSPSVTLPPGTPGTTIAEQVASVLNLEAMMNLR